MDRIVIDTEGRVSEPLGCGDDQMWRGNLSVSRIKAWEGSGTPSEITEEVAALKLLQPVPLCPALDVLIAKDLCSGIRFIFADDRGGSPKRLDPGE